MNLQTVRQSAYGPLCRRSPRSQFFNTNDFGKGTKDRAPSDGRRKTLQFTPKNGFIAFLSGLFGEHLLPRYPDLPVALVEAEKTAVICSAVFSEFLWLATGGLGQFNDHVKVLLGRKVIAIPDLGAYDLWRKKAQEYPLLDITVSDYLEKNATAELREMGADLADWVVERLATGKGIQ